MRNDHLCSHCRSFLDQVQQPGNRPGWTIPGGKIIRWKQVSDEPMQKVHWFPHWPSFCAFMSSARSGCCHLCALFMLQVSPKERQVFAAFEDESSTRALEIGLQDAQHREAGRYELFLRHPILWKQRQAHSQTPDLPRLHMRASQSLFIFSHLQTRLIKFRHPLRSKNLCLPL